MTNPISKREQEVLYLIAYEYTSKEIASRLFISTHTAYSHRKNLIEKLGVKNTAGLVRVGFQRGLLFCFLIVSALSINAQIDLDLNAGLKVGESTSQEEGAIRWNPDQQDFEGWDGMHWISFTKGKNPQNGIPGDPSFLPLCADTVISDDGPLIASTGYAVDIHHTTALVTRNAFVGSDDDILFYEFDNGWSLDTSFNSVLRLSGLPNDCAVHGDRAFVTFENSNTTGELVIFERVNDKWQVDTVLSEMGAIKYGSSIDYNGQHLVVGAKHNQQDGQDFKGAIYVYEQMNGTWQLHSKWDNPNVPGTNSFGESVLVGSSFILVGSQSLTHIYAITGNIIGFLSEISFPGSALASHQSHIAIGDWFHFEDNSNEGKVIIMDANSMMITDTLDIDMTNHLFGSAIAISGDYMLITAMAAQDQGNGSEGIVYLYHYDGNNWVLMDTLDDSIGGSSDQFGFSIGFSGPNYIIGAPRADVNGESQKGKFFIGSIK